ncbi:hypothetical protein [Nonomuraea insulae]|uniref:Major facilitator superfamily (MFS) profile domain-containing protein n=1 Tax=Nonomuraea insulae TaxID=1616787 RepID=A0ABW1CJ09_9ACTN
MWSQELVPTLLRTSSQGLTLAFARVVTALVAVVVPTLLVAHSAYVFGAVLALAVVAVVIGQAWIPRLPKARDLQTPPVVADQPTAAVRDA